MNKKIKTGIKLIVTVLIFIFLIRKFNLNFSDILNGVVFLHYIIIAIFIRLIIIQLIAMNRWKLFLSQSGINESIWALTKMSLVSSFMGIFLPSQGGDIMRMYIIEKRHKNKLKDKTPSSSVIIERMIGFILLALIGLISSIFVPNLPNKKNVLFIIGTINVFLFLIVLFLLNKKCYLLLSSILKKSKVMKNVLSFIEKTHYSLLTFPYKKILIPSVLLILSLQLCTIIIVNLVFLSFDINLPFYQHMAIYPTICILSIIPISISGLGIREGFFVYFYSILGIAPTICIGVSLINYVVETFIPACIGGVLYFLNNIGLLKI